MTVPTWPSALIQRARLLSENVHDAQTDKLHQILRYLRTVETEEKDAEKAVFFAQDELVKVRKTADEARRALQDFLKLYQVPDA